MRISDLQPPAAVENFSPRRGRPTACGSLRRACLVGFDWAQARGGPWGDNAAIRSSTKIPTLQTHQWVVICCLNYGESDLSHSIRCSTFTLVADHPGLLWNKSCPAVAPGKIVLSSETLHCFHRPTNPNEKATSENQQEGRQVIV